jgi:DNA polymerase-3 subunit epsilon
MKLIKPNVSADWLSHASHEMTSWSDGPLAAFDLEATSVDPLTARMVSAALVIDRPGETPEMTTWLIKVSDIPLEATAVHGISTEESMTKGMPLGDAVTEIVASLRKLDMPVCICNGSYDFTILDRECRRATGDGFNPDFPVIDSLVCDRALDPFRRGRRTLTATLAAYDKAIKGAHRAEFDCLAVIELVRAIAARYPQFGKIDLDMLQKLQRESYSTWASEFEKYHRAYGDQDFTVSGEWSIIRGCP